MCFLSCPSAVYTTYWLLLSQTLLLWGVSWTEDIPLNPGNIQSAVLHSALLWVGLRLHIVRLLVLHATGSYWSLLAVSDTFLLQQKVKSTFYRVTPHSRRYKIHAFVIQLWNNINYPASWLRLIAMSFRNSKLHTMSAKWSAGACNVSMKSESVVIDETFTVVGVAELKLLLLGC